jgi:hypothetical protein
MDVEANMAIANAVQKGSYVYVYDEHGTELCSIFAGSWKSDGLHGFTDSAVSVRTGSYIYTYDEKGHQLSSTFAE